MLHYAQDQLPKLPPRSATRSPQWASRDGLRKLETIDTSVVSSAAGVYQLGCPILLIAQDRTARRQIRQLEREIDDLLDTHGTTLHDEAGIGPMAAATLLVEVGDPFRFARESKFARWSGTSAIALSSGEGEGLPVRHRLDFRGNRRINSVLYIAGVTQQRDVEEARILVPQRWMSNWSMPVLWRQSRAARQS